MGDDTSLNIVIKAVNAGATGVIDGVKASVNSLTAAATEVSGRLNAVGDALDSAGNKLKATGSTMTSTFTLPIVAGGLAIGKLTTDFQKNMELIRAQAGDTEDSISDLSNQVLEMAKSGSKFSPTELAKGLYYIASLGARGADAMKDLRAMTDLATVGQADMEQTTLAVNAAMVTHIKGTEDLGATIGMLNNIVGVGAMHMNDLVAAMGTGFLATAANFGVTLRDAGAALATLTDNGMRADEAATRLRMTFTLLASPSQKARDAMASVGIQGNQLADELRNKGLIPALQDLKTHLEKSGKTATEQAQIISDMFGGGRSGAAAEILIAQLERVRQKYAQITPDATNFKQALSETESMPGFKMQAAWASMQASLIQIGDKLLPAVIRLMPSVSKIADDISSSLNKMSPAQLDALVKGLVVLAAIGPGLLLVGNALKVIGIVFEGLGFIAGLFAEGGAITVGVEALGAALVAIGPPGWIILGIVAALAVAGVLIHNNWEKVVGLFHNIADAWQMIVDLFTGGDPTLKAAHASSAAWVKFAQILSGVRDAWLSFTHWVSSTWTATINAITGAMHQFVTHFWEDIGFAIGFILTLPVKVGGAFVLMSVQAMQTVGVWLANMETAYLNWVIRIVRLLLSIDWVGIFNRMVAAVGNALTATVNWITHINWAGIAASIGNVFVNMWNSVADAATAAWHYVTNLNWGAIVGGVAKGIGNAIIDLINGAMRGAFSGVPGMAGHAPQIPHFASGVSNFAGGLALVGEQGPELVNLPGGSSVIPNGQTNQMLGNTTNIYGNINLGDSSAVEAFFKRIGRNQELARRGLTPAGY